MDAPITLSGKKYALNKMYVLNKQTGNGVPLKKISIVSLVLTDYGFVLPCVYFVHLASLDHSMPD